VEAVVWALLLEEVPFLSVEECSRDFLERGDVECELVGLVDSMFRGRTGLIRLIHDTPTVKHGTKTVHLVLRIGSVALLFEF